MSRDDGRPHSFKAVHLHSTPHPAPWAETRHCNTGSATYRNSHRRGCTIIPTPLEHRMYEEASRILEAGNL